MASVRQIGFPCSGFAHHNDVGFFDGYVVVEFALHQPLVVIVNRNRHDLFSLVLSNNVLVEKYLYLAGFDQFKIGGETSVVVTFLFFTKNLVCLGHAFIANVRLITRDHQVYIFFAAAAK